MTQPAAPTTCANHPGVETTLRCNRCEKPICPSCAVLTPTGYRCKECVHGQKKKFDTAEWNDYVFGFIVAGLLSLIGSLLISLVGGIGFIGWFLVVISAPTAGAIIAEAVRRVTHRHRARSLFLTIIIAVVLGALPMVLIHVLSLNLFGILFQGIYLVLVAPAVYYRLSGIQLFK
jgi:nitrate reductase NapE component